MAQDERQLAGTATSDAPATPTNTARPANEPDSADPPVSATAGEEEQEYADDVYDEADEGYVHIRTSLFAIAATLASLLILALIAGNVYQYIHHRDESNIVTVNGTPITQAEFARSAGQQDQALQSLIDQKLIQQEAKRQKVTVSDTEINGEMGTIKQQLGSEKEFNAALQRANLTEGQLRDQIRTKDLAQKMGAKNVTVSDDDAQAFYNQNKAQFGNQSFDQTKDQIKTQLLQTKQTEAIQTWITGLRSKAKIVYHIPA